MKHSKLISIIIALVCLSGNAAAQTQQNQSSESYNQLAGAMAFILIAFLFLMLFILSAPKYKYSYERIRKKYSFLKKLSQVLNKGVPVEQEKDIMLDHDYDGIRELNNRIPPWFNLLFYGSILFAAVYLVDYHVLGSGNIMADEYNQEITIANEKREELIRTGAFINENNVTILTDAGDLDKGKQLYNVNCLPCHGPDGGGTVGPNLTDKYWIHGGGIKNIFAIIKIGVPAKGMIAWQTMMTPKQMQQVGSYILTFQGTTPVISKPPEGNLWVDTDSTRTGNDTLKTQDSNTVKKDTIK